MKPLDKLINLLGRDKVIPVIGAGVSFATASLPAWYGAIENGLTYAEDRHVIKQSQIDQARALLKSGNLIKAADLMKLALNAPNHPYSDWLEDLFGGAIVHSMDLLNSIHDLCTSMILTTNYDDLLYAPYKIQKKKVFDWSVHGQIIRALNKGEEFILHLHGTYQKPDSVILSSTDYNMLNRKKAYKSILHKLWTEYHFLFIGCSRDGIMDPDFTTVLNFMNKWFPDLPHEHFILMRGPELEKGQHQELLEKCNVHAISYGSVYDDLSGFINDINPNREKVRLRNEIFLKEINAGFERLNSSGELINNQSAVNTFIKKSLPVKAYWVDSVELKMLEGVLKDYNAQLNNKRQQLSGSQAIVRGLISISTLGENIELWNKNWHNPTKLRKSSMIDTAMIAFNCLKAFPEEMLNEIRLRASGAVHGLYFDGYLDQFINEIKYFKTQKDNTFEEIFADRYFFENLKRIIQSLSGLLAIDPEKVFPELPEAVITPEKNFKLLFLNKHEISLRSDVFPYTCEAKLYGETSLPFKNAEYTSFGDKKFILGHTSQYCFSWDPNKDLSPQIFYTAGVGEDIAHVLNSKQSSNLYSYVFTDSYLRIFKNLKVHLEAKITKRFGNIILLPDGQGFLGSTSVAANVTGNFVSKITFTGDVLPLLSIEELWELINDIPAINEVVQTLTYDKIPSIMDGYIQGTRINLSSWFGKPVITLTATVSLKYIKSSFLIIFSYENNKLIVLSKVFFPQRFCYTYALINQANRMDLVAGYLSTGNFSLVQYFQGIDQRPNTTIDGQPAIIQRNGNGNSDILNVQTISTNRLIVVQEYENLYEVSLPTMTKQSMTVEHLIKVMPISIQS